MALPHVKPKNILLLVLMVFLGCAEKKTDKTAMMTTEKNSPLLTATALLPLLEKENPILIDTRSGKNAKSAYETQHLEGALHVDLNEQLSHIGENAANGGRHPLPHLKDFANVLTALGISKNSHVVVYDDTNGAIASARFWWMLKAVGHDKVQVLNGGLQEALRTGVPTGSGEEIAKTVEPYEVSGWKLPISTMDMVEKAARNKDYLVIDVRAKERYNGEQEPIDLVAGHIPGAINVPFSSNMDARGHFLTPEELKDKYQALIGERPSQNVIVHCGSGVTACHTLLAMAHAGIEIPNLYVGSWSEWSRNDKPIGTVLNK